MPIRKFIECGPIILFAAMALTGPATAACVGSTCTLGGQLRAQIGHGLPVPISLAPAFDGDLRWGQPGAIVATSMATIQQQSPAPVGSPSTRPPRSLMLPPGAFIYDQGPVSIGVVKANLNVLAVRTNLDIVNPHPGTTPMGGPASGSLFGSAWLAYWARTGPAIVTWCAGLPGPTASFNPVCSAPDDFGFSPYCSLGTDPCILEPLTNGLIRFTKTKEQFGGAIRSRVSGTRQIFFNAGGLAIGDLPCVWGPTLNTAVTPKINPDCIVGLDVKTIGQTVGGEWSQERQSPAVTNPAGVFTARIGANGTILGYKTGTLQTITIGGTMMSPVAFKGQATTSWGVPFTTGRLTISVTQNAAAPTRSEIFTRTGGDNRTVGGQGIVVLVSGALSARSISGPSGDRRWMTLNVPEPDALAAGAVGILALAGCHAGARRRSG